MAFALYLLGWSAFFIGGGWAAISLCANLQPVFAGGPLPSLTALLALAVATPGLAMMFAGLLLLAAGGILARLGRIARNTDDLLDALEARPFYTPPSPVAPSVAPPPPPPRPPAEPEGPIEPRL